jgi:hypothetical protein
MKRPQQIMLCSETTSLEGVRQFFVQVGVSDSSPADRPSSSALALSSGSVKQDVDAIFAEKVEVLLRLLSSLSFHQVRLLSNLSFHQGWLLSSLSLSTLYRHYLC